MTANNKYVSSPAFFEEKYQEKSDPWNFAHSKYELQRYQAIVAALDHDHYSLAYEPGCSIGVLTEHLAAICDRVEAIDFSETAVAHARARCVHLGNMSVRCASLPEQKPVIGVDLMVLSEIGYYFSPGEWRRISSALIESMDKDGTLLAAHWLSDSSDHCMNGAQVHEILSALPNIQLKHSERRDKLRIDRWVRG